MFRKLQVLIITVTYSFQVLHVPAYYNHRYILVYRFKVINGSNTINISEHYLLHLNRSKISPDLYNFSSTPRKKSANPRGRPRNDTKKKLDTSNSTIDSDPDFIPPVKRGRGRPRKYFPAAENET